MTYMDKQKIARARELGLDDGQIDGLNKLMGKPANPDNRRRRPLLPRLRVLASGFKPETKPKLKRSLAPPPVPPPKARFQPAQGGKEPEDFLPPQATPLSGGQSGQGIPSFLREQYGVDEETPNKADPGAAPAGTPPTGTPGPGAGQGGGTQAVTRFVQPPQATQQPTAAPQSDPMGGVNVAQAVAAPVMIALDNWAATAQTGLDEQKLAYEAIAERTRQQAVKQRAMSVTMEAQQQERLRAQENVMGEYKSAEEERKAFKFKKPWADRGMGNKILAVLAAAIGGYGAGLTGGPNYALQILQQSFDEDIELQKEKYAQLGDAAQSKLTTLGHMRSRFADERQAEAATRLAMLEETQTELNVLTVGLKSAEQKQAKADLIAQIEVKKAQERVRFFQPVVEAAATRAAQPAFDPNNTETWGKDRRERAVFDASGQPIGMANNAYNAKKATATIQNAHLIEEDLTRLIQMSEEFGYESWGSEDRALSQKMTDRVQARMKKLQELGANLTKNEEKFMLLRENPLSAFRQGRARAELREILAGIQRERNTVLASAGITYSEGYQPTTFQPDEE